MDRLYSPGVQLLTVEARRIGRWWERHRFGAPYWRVYWNETAGAEVQFAGRAVQLTPARLVAIPPETDFTVRCPRQPRHLYLHFLAQRPFDNIEPGLHPVPAGGLLRRLARELMAMTLAGEESPRGPLLALTLIHAALAHVPASALRAAPDDARIAQALAEMDAKLDEPLTNAELAERVGMSRNAFIRLFHQATGSTPQQVYTRKRIERTCMQLHYTELKLEQIAAMAGFCDRYHFSRTFKRLRGIGPAAFRRQVTHARDPRATPSASIPPQGALVRS